MGAGVSHLILVNRTGYQVMVTAQLVQPKPDRPIEDPKIVQVAANGTTTLDLTRNQNFDVRCNIIFNLSNGSSGRIRINVPPKEITRNIDITHGMILVDGNNSGSIVGGIETPPAYEEDAGSLKPFVDGVPEKRTHSRLLVSARLCLTSNTSRATADISKHNAKGIQSHFHVLVQRKVASSA